MPGDFPAIVALFRARNEVRLAHILAEDVRLVTITATALTLAAPPRVPRDQLALIARRLSEWTGSDWRVDIVADGGAPTLREAELAAADGRRVAARADPLVAAVFASFPDAEIIAVDADERTSHAQSR